MGTSKASRRRASRSQHSSSNPAAAGPRIRGKVLMDGGEVTLAEYMARRDEAIARSRPGYDPVQAIADAVERRQLLDGEISELVRAARSQGVTWDRIAAASLLSRDGAVSRWGRRRSSS